MRRSRASIRSATSRATKRTGSGTPSIESGASTAASAPWAIAKSRFASVSSRVCAVTPAQASIGRSPRPSAALHFATSSAHSWTTRWRTSLSIRSHSPVVPAANTMSAPYPLCATKCTSARWPSGSSSPWASSTVTTGTESPGRGRACSTDRIARRRYRPPRVFRPGSDSLEEVGHPHLERGGELVERRHGGGRFAELDLRDQGDRESSAVGELLQRERGLRPALAQALADDLVEPRLHVDEQALLADRRVDHVAELLEVDRLLQIVERVLLHRAHGDVDGRHRGHRDHADVRVGG